MSLAVWDKNRCVGSRGGCFGVGLSIHHQARFERLDFIDIAGGLLGLGSGFLGVLVVGLDVLGHVFCLFS